MTGTKISDYFYNATTSLYTVYMYARIQEHMSHHKANIHIHSLYMCSILEHMYIHSLLYLTTTGDSNVVVLLCQWREVIETLRLGVTYGAGGGVVGVHGAGSRGLPSERVLTWIVFIPS